MLLRDLLHDLHRELVVVCSYVGRGVDRRKLMLSRSDLVMLSLGQDAQLPEFFIQVFHEFRDARLDHAEIVVIHFLPFRRLGAEQRAPGKAKIRPRIIHFFCYQKIFLLRSDRRDDTFRGIVAEEPEYSESLSAQDFHGPEKRRFLIQRVSAV